MGTSVLFARGVLSEVQSRGLAPEGLLERCNIDARRLTDLRALLTVEEADALAREAIAVTGDAGLGLSLAVNAPLHMLQIFGHLVLAQPTLRDAFGVVERYASLLSDGGGYTLTECGAIAVFSCSPHVQLGESTRLAVDYTLAMAARLCSCFVPERPGLLRAGFQHAQPDYAARYQELFGCSVSFGEQDNTLTFPRSWLDAQQAHGDEAMSKLLTETADRLLHERSATEHLSQRIRTMLRYERELHEMSLSVVARRLGLTTRALRRHLSEEGVSLTRLIDEVRCALSCDELRRPGASIRDTAKRLGFSEPSAFHRAFRRWTGLTPARYARSHRLAASSSRTSAPRKAVGAAALMS